MNQIKVLGCPYSFGQKHQGVAHSPRYLRDFGLLSELKMLSQVEDLGDIDFSLCQGRIKDHIIKEAHVNSLANELISCAIENENLSRSFLLNLGGDHGMALGSVHGVLSHYPDAVVVWADAHGDINTPASSPSGNFHGMPLAFILGLVSNEKIFPWIKRFLSPQKLILIGPRDLDPSEKDIIKELSIQYYSSEVLNAEGSPYLLKKALKLADPTGTCPIHLSFDVDVFDQQDLFSTGTRVFCGPRIPEIFNIGKALAQTGRLRSMDLVELNQNLGNQFEIRQSFFLAMKFITFTLKHIPDFEKLEMEEALFRAPLHNENLIV